jgi:hypothetical protein
MLILRAAEFVIRVIDGLKKILEAGGVVDRPEAGKSMSEQLHLTLGEQPDSNDPFLRQRGAPTF